jgi:hypothetical protein
VETVPLAHLVRAARRIGRSASEIAARMEELGYSTAVGHETVGVDPDDLVLLSRDLDGSRPWLDPAQPVVLPHLLKAAQRTNRTVRDVVARLLRVGLQIDVDISVLPIETLDPADLIMASRDLDGSFPWVDQSEPVSLVHLVRVAHRLQRDIADVAARLAALGYPLTPGCEALHTEADDLVLISRDLDGASPWLDPSETVSAVHLVRAAEKSGRAPASVVARLALFGFRSVTADLTGVTLTADDLTMLSRDLDASYPWLDPERPVSTLHLLRAAESTSRPVAEVASRLASLGYEVTVNPDEIIVDHLDPDDVTLASVDLDGAHPWLDITQPVPAVHLLRAARVTGRDLHDVAARLTVFGYTVRTDFGELTVDQLTRDDLLITSRDLDGSDPWIPPGERILLPHVLQAARRTRKPAAEIVHRLRQLGYPVEVDLTAVSTDKIRSSDLVFASNDLDGTRPWLDPDLPVPLSHVLAAAHKVHQPISEIARRLEALGYRAPDLDVRLPRAFPGGF